VSLGLSAFVNHLSQRFAQSLMQQRNQVYRGELFGFDVQLVPGVRVRELVVAGEEDIEVGGLKLGQ
jgi:hypothetical protein